MAAPVSYRLATSCVRRAITAAAAAAAAAAGPTRRHSVLAAAATTAGRTASFSTTTTTTTTITETDVRPAAFSSSKTVEKLISTIHKAALYNQGAPGAPKKKKQIQSHRPERRQHFWDYELCRRTADAYEQHLLAAKTDAQLLKPELVSQAFSVLLRCKLNPDELSQRVRTWEKALGKQAATPLTESLSRKLLVANAKAGNIGRVLSLLDYRLQHEHEPKRYEFLHAIVAVEVAGWSLREGRNSFLSDRQQPVIDDPTRWLDAILLNMSARHFPLDQHLATMMLDTFATRGHSGKAQHYFYHVVKTRLSEEELDALDMEDEEDMPSQHGYKVRLKMNKPPPYSKVPTEMQGKTLTKDDKAVSKLERELQSDFSQPLSAAFSFADSLAHGACGHDPIPLNVVGYNVLIKNCVYRGALHRALHLLDTVMPAANIPPNHRSYDQVLSGLARVGDVTLMRDYYQQMLTRGIAPSHYTVQCIVNGLLNLGDVSSAITVIQDFFNQHQVLPPITTQLKVLEFALGLEQVYEAKRHVYFIQQLWKWEPHYQYEEREFIYFMKTYQQDERISKEALQHLFKYFGAKLDESDFF